MNCKPATAAATDKNITLADIIRSDSHTERLALPCNPSWSLRVTGREFARYLAAARSKPRRSIFGLPVIDPLSRFATIWGTITTGVDLVYTAFLVPLSLAFNDYTTINMYWVYDFIGSAVYLLDILIEFHMGFQVRWDSSSLTITDGRLVAWNYFRHGTFWIDFIAALPLIGQLVLVFTNEGQMSNQAVRLILLLKLLRLLRVVNLISKMNKMEASGLIQHYMSIHMNAVTVFVLNTMFSMMVMLNLISCLWWWIAVTEGLENSWVASIEITKPEMDLYNASDGTQWLVCAYFALVTMATIGE